ncbi:hypothetical protein [Peribacillus kribbensis]|uniref:hypothetical protein n=1 Tax=Peribacillus kribbensis TaxID=356658 RepID=UPI00041A4D58|nr:hypothetical protein [Peribacillus kribbensis]
MIKEQSKLTSSSRLVFAQNAGHSIHLDRPDLVISQFEELSLQIRNMTLKA